MARHSTGQNNYRVALWVIIVLPLAVLAVCGWFVYGIMHSKDGMWEQTDAKALATVSATVSSSAAPPATDSQTSAVPAATESNVSEPHQAQQAPTQSTSAAANVSARDTLFLLDTSTGLAPAFEPVTSQIATNAKALTDAGHLVALWNYSSPLNPGVTVGYRDNLGFGSGYDVADAVTRFGTGGFPQTRSALLAALSVASDHGQPVRVVLVTTGTAGDMDDPSFANAIKETKPSNAELSVVQLGEAEADKAVDAAADSYRVVSDPTDSAAVQQALNAATGA